MTNYTDKIDKYKSIVDKIKIAWTEMIFLSKLQDDKLNFIHIYKGAWSTNEQPSTN